jgi:hypothetical protein
MTLREILVDFLAAEELGFVDDAGDLLLHCRGEHGEWPCVANVRAEQGQVTFRSVYPGVVPQETRLPTMELVTRLNAGLEFGNFDLDLDTGALSYRTSVDVEFDRLSEGLLRSLVFVNVATMDALLPVLREVTAAEPGTAEPARPNRGGARE